MALTSNLLALAVKTCTPCRTLIISLQVGLWSRATVLTVQCYHCLTTVIPGVIIPTSWWEDQLFAFSKDVVQKQAPMVIWDNDGFRALAATAVHVGTATIAEVYFPFHPYILILGPHTNGMTGAI